MIGASDRPDRPSYGVMRFLQDHGYRVLPVNPQITGEHVHGEFVWRELAQIGVPIDIVDIFRRPEAAGEAVDQAILAGAKAVWMQLGVINEEAAARAEAAGLKVVMDRCPEIEIRGWACRRWRRRSPDGRLQLIYLVPIVSGLPSGSPSTVPPLCAGAGEQDPGKMGRRHRRARQRRIAAVLVGRVDARSRLGIIDRRVAVVRIRRPRVVGIGGARALGEGRHGVDVGAVGARRRVVGRRIRFVAGGERELHAGRGGIDHRLVERLRNAAAEAHVGDVAADGRWPAT